MLSIPDFKNKFYLVCLWIITFAILFPVDKVLAENNTAPVVKIYARSEFNKEIQWYGTGTVLRTDSSGDSIFILTSSHVNINVPVQSADDEKAINISLTCPKGICNETLTLEGELESVNAFNDLATLRVLKPVNPRSLNSYRELLSKAWRAEDQVQGTDPENSSAPSRYVSPGDAVTITGFPARNVGMSVVTTNLVSTTGNGHSFPLISHTLELDATLEKGWSGAPLSLVNTQKIAGIVSEQVLRMELRPGQLPKIAIRSNEETKFEDSSKFMLRHLELAIPMEAVSPWIEQTILRQTKVNIPLDFHGQLNNTVSFTSEGLHFSENEGCSLSTLVGGDGIGIGGDGIGIGGSTAPDKKAPQPTPSKIACTIFIKRSDTVGFDWPFTSEIPWFSDIKLELDSQPLATIAVRLVKSNGRYKQVRSLMHFLKLTQQDHAVPMWKSEFTTTRVNKELNELQALGKTLEIESDIFAGKLQKKDKVSKLISRVKEISRILQELELEELNSEELKVMHTHPDVELLIQLDFRLWESFHRNLSQVQELLFSKTTSD